MTSQLKRVPHFGKFPDGRLRAGPFRSMPVTSLQALMSRFGICLGEGNQTGMISATASGLMMSSSGSGVRGYFVDAEGLEISSTDLDRFILEATEPHTAIRISGHNSPGPESTVVSEATAMHDGHEVTWSAQRVIQNDRGGMQMIGAVLPGPSVPAVYATGRHNPSGLHIV